jgi:hypothetical protein
VEQIVLEVHLKGISLEDAEKVMLNLLGELQYVYHAEILTAGVAKETENEDAEEI